MDFKIIANICSVICSVFNLSSTFWKKKENIFLSQTLGKFFAVLSNFFIGSFAGVVANIIGMIRNFLNAKGKSTKFNTIIILILSVILGLAVNKLGFIGFLPIIAGIQYTVQCFLAKNGQQVRIAVCINVLIYFVHDIFVGLYFSAITQIIYCCISLVNYFKYKEEEKKEKEIEDNKKEELL